MTSMRLRQLLVLTSQLRPQTRNITHGPGEWREIRATGYAPKYKDEFAKLRIPKPDPPLISNEHVIVSIVLVTCALAYIRRRIIHWKQEAEHRRQTEYRRTMNRVVDDLSIEYRKILDQRFPN